MKYKRIRTLTEILNLSYDEMSYEERVKLRYEHVQNTGNIIVREKVILSYYCLKISVFLLLVEHYFMILKLENLR